jgi:hypothetical protein
MIDTIEAQFATVRARYPEASMAAEADGSQLVHMPSVPLPAGWSAPSSGIWFVLPPGYPTVRPDCFYADADLRLASGADPGNSSMQAIGGQARRWFSWHLTSWDETRDGLMQYVRFIERRLAEVH